MIKSVSAWVALFVAGVLLAAAIGYRALVYKPPHQAALPDSEYADQIPVPSDAGHSNNVPVDAAQADRSPVSSGPDGLHQDLLVMKEPYRNHILWLTIRDAGFKCDEVKASQLLGVETGAWRAHCGGISTYLVIIGEFGNVSVKPILYGDFGPGAILLDELR